MSRLAVTLIDVGWGDSIFVESEDNAGNIHYALVDCNDYENERSSLIFVKRFFHRHGVDYEHNKPNFEWVLLTHGHADHARGLKRMMQEFGAKNFWYPKSVPSTTHGTLLNFANRSSNVVHHQAVDESKVLDGTITFGDASLAVLWPNYDQVDPVNENNNSVVLAMTLGSVTFVLTGDAEADNWPQILPRLPATTRVFQHPHHGARNGLFDSAGSSPWLDQLKSDNVIVMSSHVRPHGHPHPAVIKALQDRNFLHHRTDLHYHVTVETNGVDVTSIFTR